MTEWPDWTGWPAAIVASGPSARREDLSPLKGRFRIIAIKKSHELVPWGADVVYSCDAPWWESVSGLPSFRGLKLSYDHLVVGRYGIRKVDIPDLKLDDFAFDQVGCVGAGGASGFHATNLAAQFGAARIALIGMDCNGGPGREHWYGRNNAMKMSNPTSQQYDRWVKAFERGSVTLLKRGVEVINCSFESSIKSFPKRTIREVVDKWCRD